jgi:glycosyltransferase involved in cell wall biosynthesis
MSKHLFTVFTPTYNRAHTLGRVYQSLLTQTFTDFEWLIVDDGSLDGTEELVHGFIAEEKIVIRYYKQPNGGKHVAYNRGVREANGQLFLSFDSDDSCIPVALERFRTHWMEIPKLQRDGFSGITCLCRDEKGKVVGGVLPAGILDGHPYEVTSQYRLIGEKWGFHRTEILKMYPFPEFPEERFVPESLVWNRVGKNYKIRFINEALRCYFNSEDSLSSSMVKIRLKSPKSTFLYYFEALDLPIKLVDLLKISSNLWRFALPSHQWPKILSKRRPLLLIIAGFFPGVALAIKDKLRTNSAA